jgi:hypothetical protein
MRFSVTSVCSLGAITTNTSDQATALETYQKGLSDPTVNFVQMVVDGAIVKAEARQSSTGFYRWMTLFPEGLPA